MKLQARLEIANSSALKSMNCLSDLLRSYFIIDNELKTEDIIRLGRRYKCILQSLCQRICRSDGK